MDLDLQAGLEDAWATIVLVVPRLLAFLAILLIGIVVAKLVERAVDALLERVGFDRAVERGGVARAMGRVELDASDIVAKVAYYAIMLITLMIAFNVFGPNPVSDLLTEVVAWLPRLLVAVVIVVIAAAIAQAARTLVRGTLGGLSYGNALATAAWAAILGLGIIAALNQVGIATAITTPILIAVLATAGGVIVVGVGGGLVQPMQARWERALGRAEEEAPRVRERMRREPTAPRTTPLDASVFDRPYPGPAATGERGSGGRGTA